MELTTDEIALIRIALNITTVEYNNKLNGIGKYAGKRDMTVQTRTVYNNLVALDNKLSTMERGLWKKFTHLE